MATVSKTSADRTAREEYLELMSGKPISADEIASVPGNARLTKICRETIALPYTAPSDSSKIYPLSNEYLIEKNLKQLESGEQGGTFVGASGWQCLDMIAAQHADSGLIVDINLRVCEFHRLTRQIILESSTPAEFMEKFMIKIASVLNPGDFKKLQEAYEKNTIYWLQNTERFSWIKLMYEKDQIQITNQNMASPAFIAILNTCELASIRTIYVSNIVDWLPSKPHELSTLNYMVQMLMKSNPLLQILYSDRVEPTPDSSIPLTLRLSTCATRKTMKEPFTLLNTKLMSLVDYCFGSWILSHRSKT